MDDILFEVNEGLAIITLNRPQKMNAFTGAMLLELQRIFGRCAADDSVRAIYFSGNGRAFSAGQDLSAIPAADKKQMDHVLATWYNPLVLAIRTIEKPVVCAVNGVAAGAAANIAICCDVVVAARSAIFIQAFSKIGLIPDSAGTFMLPRLIGWQRASALMMLGDKVDAVEAERFGMVYKIFDDGVFAAESLKLAKTLTEMPTRALAFIKQALNASISNDLNQQLKVEETLQAAAAQTADHQEGVAAFLEKRPPTFNGM